jgi:hypothetical protein
MTNSVDDGDALPNNVFTFLSTPDRVDRAGTYWTLDESGTYPAIANDSGTIGSLQTHFDDKHALFTAHTTDQDAHALTLDPMSATGNITERVTAVDTAGGAVTATLPAAASVSGLIFIVQRLDATNTLTIEGNGAETINGAANIALAAAYDAVQLYSSGLGWTVVGAAGSDVAYP